MDITFAGAAREVTGSCHLVRVGDRLVALDCGMFQGHRQESDRKNRELPVSVEKLSALVLSHAHIDHAGRVPFLVRNGFKGPIYCTPATRDLSAYMLQDSAHIQVKDAEHLAKRGKGFVEPLYDGTDVARALERVIAIPYGREFEVTPGIRASFVDAGHILGSASVVLDCRENGVERRLIFSGDIGRSSDAAVFDGSTVVPASAPAIGRPHRNAGQAPLDRARGSLSRASRGPA